MSTPTDVILRELKSIDIGAIDPHNMARTLSRVLDLTIPALSEIAAHPPTSELVEAGKELICTHNGFEAIKNALHRASARIGCPPGDNADADLYRELSHAAESVSRLSAHPKEVAPTVDQVAELIHAWSKDHYGRGVSAKKYHDLRARLKTLFP